MRRYYYLILILCLFAYKLSAQNNIAIVRGERPLIQLDNVAPTAYEQDKISVKLNNFALHNISTDVSGKMMTNINHLNALNQQYGLLNFKALFSHKKLIENTVILHEAWGLNKWYSLQFNNSVNIKKILKAYLQTGLFEVVEPVYKKHLLDKEDKVDYIPNDPRLASQWHFKNTGQQGGTPGCDVHVTQAWDIETGDTNIIVAVMDQGVQLDHPDLQQNIAYKKSYNFVYDTSLIKPNDHGSHVAGTIGEVNNNGIGGSGIAGGNGSINSGIRIMSCEDFEPDGTSGNIAQSYIYASDNGACISNNSWAYDDEGVYELSVLDAIDYFIQNGGGNNIMQGGLVIFAAGNNGAPKKLYPPAYDRVICVAATNNKDKKTFYSNYGNWVDIAAPGGEFGNYTDVISCNSHSDYMFDHGTSMACPHVAGVAALIASYLKGKTSASDVREILLSTTDNIDSMNPGFISKIGSGRVNAYQALLKAKAIADNKNVNPVSSVKVVVDCNNSFTVNWTKNPAGNDVILAYNNTGGIGVLSDGKAYSAGDSIAGGGTIIYKGNALSYQYNTAIKDLYHYFKIWSIGSNNKYSLGKTYDTVLHYTTSVAGYNAIVQNFNYPPLFPTLEWSTINPDNDLTWTHSIEVDTAAMGAGDHYSMAMYNYQYNTILGAVDWLTSPTLLLNNPDSLKLSFWHSYQYRNTGLPINDSLEVLVSNDCGKTYTSLWKKGGQELATIPDTTNGEWKPSDIRDWQQDFIDLSSFKTNAKLMVVFRSVNGEGNNLFLDNINMNVVYKNDAALKSILQPAGNYCSNVVSPADVIYNNGDNSITSAQIKYSIDGGSTISSSWTGNLYKGDSVMVKLNNCLTAPGNHLIKTYISSVNQITDSFNGNDTLVNTFSTSSTINLPLNESFEGTTFPPAGWRIQQAAYDSIYWQRNKLAASNGNASALLPNIMELVNYGRTEDLITPSIAIGKVDSVFLLFDLSYDTTRRATKPLMYDTLQVDISTDCGNNWQTIYKKWGATLQTNNLPATGIEYIPGSISQWRTDSLNLTGLVSMGDTFSIRFRNIENNGNDLYLDNVRIYSKIHSSLLSQNGYVIYPNPFNNKIVVSHLNKPSTLKSIMLFDILGKRVAEYDYNGTASTNETINTGNIAAGMYIIKLFYSDKTIEQKMIKVSH